ncbi:hypothetical protein H2198_002479 [Neophaeococcomyces mojaviensis]|uniref:Uncharacterized protein n=1 Tax=Neophaeococcomyces mojaviensis TaxID=3383035 RepID=A0ACC3AEH6_9EURO|nr:hypothetical protein H2198_002479 [Knufia sp. JES_112]
MSGRARGGKIRAPRRALTKDDVDCESVWEVLHRAFREIHARNASQLSFEELFRNAYKLVLKKKGEFLFENVKSLEISILDTDVKSRIVDLATPSLLLSGSSETSSVEKRTAGERFISALTKSYQDYSIEVGMITDVLMYMDRISTAEGRKPSIFTIALGLFRERILRAAVSEELSMSILDLLEMTLLDMIALERSGEMIDRPLIKASCRMLENLYETITEEESTKLYLTSFEPKYLDASRDYYRNEGQLLLQEADATTFCSQASRRLKEESERCQQSLSRVTEPKIIAVIEKELIAAHIAEVINLPGTGIRAMITNDKIDDLRNLYDLVHRIDQRLKPLKDAVHNLVLEVGEEINKSALQTASEKQQPKAPEKKEPGKGPPPKPLNQQTVAAVNWVEEVLKLKAKYDKLWERAFRCDGVMEKSLEISFQDFINGNSRAPEFVSLFLDQYLKSNGKDKTEAEVDALLDSGVTLLQYLADKDILESYYHKHMAKRLLMNKTISRDVERSMLSKMKVKLGNQFTVKMEGLLKDVELSENLTKQYKDYAAKLEAKKSSKVDLEMHVLTMTVWPIFTSESELRSCVYPAEVAQVKESFEKFYLGKHTGRKLTWMHHMGEATMRATFKKDGQAVTYEVAVPTFCMMVLMLFNDHEKLTFDEIQQLTNIPTEQLIRTMQSVAVAPKTRLLKKEPMSRDVNPTDEFSHNPDFKHQFRKFKVALVSEQSNKVENAEERKETQKKADDQRGLLVDAAVVRIMKARKSLTHQQLMTETIQILSSRFQPEVAMIKKKIETLIDREYLERGPDPANPSYNYLA